MSYGSLNHTETFHEFKGDLNVVWFSEPYKKFLRLRKRGLDVTQSKNSVFKGFDLKEKKLKERDAGGNGGNEIVQRRF
jgi:hypothetical protein